MADNFDVTRAVSSLDAMAAICKQLPPGYAPEIAQNVEVLRRELAAADEEIRQLVRGLREATEPPTFMGEPVARRPSLTLMPVERIAALWNSLPLETDAQSVVAFVRAVEDYHGVEKLYGMEQAVREWNDSLPAGTLGEVHIRTLLGRLGARRSAILQRAAPDLLEALQAFPGFTDDATVGDPWIEKMRAAIAKATGEQAREALPAGVGADQQRLATTRKHVTKEASDGQE